MVDIDRSESGNQFVETIAGALYKNGWAIAIIVYPISAKINDTFIKHLSKSPIVVRLIPVIIPKRKPFLFSMATLGRNIGANAII